MARFVKASITITDSAPIVNRRSFCFAQSSSNHAERKVFHDSLDHGLESIDFKSRDAFVHAGNFVTERGGKIFFVAENHINKWSDAAIHNLRLLFSAEGSPERVAII